MSIVLIVIGVIVLGLVIWLISIDGSYHVKKTKVIHVPKEKAYELISDFKTWKSWSPWLCMEPDAKVTMTNDGLGVGAINSWIGSLVGSGEIEHLELMENESIRQEIRFLKPFKSKSEVYWQFNDADGGCEVTWGMKGAMPFFLKFMAKQMEPWIGMDYERGLKMIKDLMEKGKINSVVTLEGVSELDSFEFVAIKETCLMNEVGESMKATFAKINALCETEKVEPETAFSIYHKFDFTDPECTYSSGVPVKSDLMPGDEFYKDRYPKIRAIKVLFKGDYEHLGNGWAAAYSYLRYKKLKANKKIDPIEVYLNDPIIVVDPADWLTAIYIPIK
ncbi:SRPBCC family protein [Carboxylicivirga sp. A043]|uniref:SRPBCC family protein n=1 Tax=Carboxylicivirga litoralis TaxID=2816963 RepID=UPI0021CAFE58|nr:GyrI-like domain-containing protein [Carboxylicivirga sp. A043]MCU4154643.1 SRPBCC family protein [Carboxylicivirga sp. A043]